MTLILCSVLHDVTWWLTLAALLLTAAGTIPSYTLQGFLFRWLVTRRYDDASWFFPGMVLGAGPFTSGHFAVTTLLSKTDVRGLVAPKVLSAVLGMPLNVSGAALWRRRLGALRDPPGSGWGPHPAPLSPVRRVGRVSHFFRELCPNDG